MKKELIKCFFEYKLIKTSFVKGTLFTLASSWKSPIYIDCRGAMAHPNMMDLIKRLFFEVVRPRKFDGVIAVAKGAIPHGTLLAESLVLPFGYVSIETKNHGLGKQIEGMDVAGKHIFLIDDLITTGKSVIACANILKDAGASSIFIASIFSYDLDEAKHNFEGAGFEPHSLVNMHDIASALTQLVGPEHLFSIEYFIQHPKDWQRLFAANSTI